MGPDERLVRQETLPVCPVAYDDACFMNGSYSCVISTLPLALRRFQVFRGGLPPYVERAIEKIPEVRLLIVPVEKLDEARMKTEKAGTNEFRLFDAVKKAAEGVK